MEIFGGGGKSPEPPRAPPMPKTPTREEIAAEDYAKRAAELRALREEALNRNRTLSERGRQSLTNPGLGIPE
jgi:hypothetical protein